MDDNELLITGKIDLSQVYSELDKVAKKASEALSVKSSTSTSNRSKLTEEEKAAAKAANEKAKAEEKAAKEAEKAAAAVVKAAKQSADALAKAKAALEAESQRRSKLLEAAEQLNSADAEDAALLAKINTELASISAKEAKRAKDAETLNAALKQEIEYRKQANAASNTASANGKESGLYSAHSERQRELLKNIKGGNSLQNIFNIKNGNEIAGGISQVGGAAGIPGMDALQGLAGAATATGAAFAITAVAAKAVVDGLNYLGQKAKDASTYVSDSGGKFDQLRNATDQLKQSQDKLANSKLGAAFETLKTQVETAAFSIVNKLITSPEEQQQQKQSQGLKLAGDTKVAYDEMRRDEMLAARDTAKERASLERDFYQQKRDFAQEEADFEREQSYKKADLEKQAIRENAQFQLEMQRTVDDQAFKSSEEKYALDRQNAARDQGLKEADAKQSFDMERRFAEDNLNFKQDLAKKETDFKQKLDQDQLKRKQGIDKETYGIGRGDKFQDYQKDLVDMMMGGSASGLDYFKKARDFNIGIGREDRNFKRQQQLEKAQQKYDQERARKEQAFSQSGEQASFAREQAQGAEKFGVEQGRSRRDYLNREMDTAAGHEIEVKQHVYEVTQKLIDLTRAHAYALEDEATARQRQREEETVGRKKLSNRADDMAYNEKVARQNQKDSEADRAYTQNKSRMDFASGLYDRNSEMFNELAKQNPDFAKWLNADRARKGFSPVATGENSPQQKAADKSSADSAQWAAWIAKYGPGIAIPGVGGMAAGNLWGSEKQQQADRERADFERKYGKMTGQRFATGGPVMDTGLAHVDKGEFVLTKDQVKFVAANQGQQRPYGNIDFSWMDMPAGFKGAANGYDADFEDFKAKSAQYRANMDRSRAKAWQDLIEQTNANNAQGGSPETKDFKPGVTVGKAVDIVNSAFGSMGGKGGSIGHFANGGPVNDTGLAMVHKGEYVIDAVTAKQLKLTGGNQLPFVNLAQGDTQQMPLGLRGGMPQTGGGGSVNLNMPVNISTTSNVSPQDLQAAMRDIKNFTEQRLQQVTKTAVTTSFAVNRLAAGSSMGGGY